MNIKPHGISLRKYLDTQHPKINVKDIKVEKEHITSSGNNRSLQ
jgi:hypothetical protein